jgi:epoxyqueuosine reductase
MSLTADLKALAGQLGFRLTGACPAVTPAGIHRFYEWLDRGYAGSMDYLERRRPAYAHPRHVLPGARSLLMLGMPYRNEEPAAAKPLTGRVSRYSWGTLDYHDVIQTRLKQLVKFLKSREPGCEARGVVDSAPLLEREFAQLAGLGWNGKHTLLINPQQGSWFFLAAILTDVELQYDAPFATDHCGTCRACLDACPTDAFPQPYVLDATRCISYLTIELRDVVPTALRNDLQDWVFGCDVCQEVCPWNRKAPISDEAAFAPRDDRWRLDLPRLFELDDEQYRQLFRKTPLWRAKRRGLLRNAAIVLGNQADPAAVGPLRRGLSDQEPIVRAACVWALRQFLPNEDARLALKTHEPTEPDAIVLAEFGAETPERRGDAGASRAEERVSSPCDTTDRAPLPNLRASLRE